MSVLEVAKIQVRRGDARVTGIPNLDAGEFGWAIAGTNINKTTPELYIGNGSLQEGAAVEGITRILTEYDTFSDILSYSNTYNYKGNGGIDLSGYSTNRTIQSKLDDIVTAWDFADIASGAPVITGGSIQNAINFIYKNFGQANPFARVGLIIPPGVFEFSNTVLIPPYVTLIGAGKERTIFEVASNEAVLQFCDSDGFIFVDGSTDIQAAKVPKYITISGITFRHKNTLGPTTVFPLIRADCSLESSIVNCGFVGLYTPGSTSNVLNCGIEIRGQGPIISENLLIDNCTFKNLYFGIDSTYDIEDTVINNCRFENLYQGVSHGRLISINNYTGPLRTKLHANKFYNVEREGFYVGISDVPTSHVSSSNTFKNVGNDLNGDYNAVVPVVNFLSSGNSSIGDYSTRFTTVNSTSTGIVNALPIGGKMYTDLNAVYSAEMATTYTTATVTLVKFPYSDPETLVNIDYSIFNAGIGITRKGSMVLNAGTIGTGPVASMSDRFSYMGNTINSDGGVTFSVELSTSTNTINLNYLCIQSGNTITYKYSQLQ